MAEVDNKQVIFKGYPENVPEESDMELKVSKMKLEAPKGSGAILVNNLFHSCDSYMGGRKPNLSDSYIPHFVPGQPLGGFGVSRVIDSDNPAFKPYDLVVLETGWEEYSLIHRPKQCTKIDQDEIALSYHLRRLGMAGFTSYAGFFEVCTPKEGECVFVSAASRASGQLLGELAKKLGCYVVGSAGTSQEVDLLKNKLGFDDAFNYKEVPDFNAALKRYFPQGIDIYVDNVGGDMLNAARHNLRIDGRIAICGVGNQLLDYLHLYPGFLKDGITKIKRVKIVYIEGMDEGLDGAPAASDGLLSGKKLGKRIIRKAKKLTIMLAKIAAVSFGADVVGGAISG